MITNAEINKRINDTLDAAESIKEVQVSTFFKAHMMHQIRNASENVQEATWPWFTPKLQLATLICFVVLNFIAIDNLKTTTYSENVSNFAESYGLSTNTENSIIN